MVACRSSLRAGTGAPARRSSTGFPPRTRSGTSCTRHPEKLGFGETDRQCAESGLECLRRRLRCSVWLRVFSAEERGAQTEEYTREATLGYGVCGLRRLGLAAVWALQQSHQRLQLSCKLQRGAQVIASGPRKRVKLMEPAPQRDVTERDLSPNGGQGIPRLACRESAPSSAIWSERCESRLRDASSGRRESPYGGVGRGICERAGWEVAARCPNSAPA